MLNLGLLQRPKRFDNIQNRYPADANFIVTVANAKPDIPSPSVNVSRGFNPRLRKNPYARTLRLDFVSPNAMSTPAAANDRIKVNAPMMVIPMYSIDRGAISSSAPRNLTKGSAHKSPVIETITLKNKARPSTWSVRSATPSVLLRPTSGAMTADAPVCIPIPMANIRKNTLPAMDTPASASSESFPANQKSDRLYKVLNIIPIDAGIDSRSRWLKTDPSVSVVFSGFMPVVVGLMMR